MQPVLPTEYLSKIISGNCLTVQVLEMALIVGANKRLTKKLKKKNCREKCSQGSKKRSNIFHIFLGIYRAMHIGDLCMITKDLRKL